MFGYDTAIVRLRKSRNKNVPASKPERSIIISLNLKTQRLYLINSHPFHSSGFGSNYTGLAVFKNKAICRGNA
jgi:hypothetical protein